MFTTRRVRCPVCGNHADVCDHYTRRSVFGSCERCGTLGSGLRSGLIEHRKWIAIPDW